MALLLVARFLIVDVKWTKTNGGSRTRALSCRNDACSGFDFRETNSEAIPTREGSYCPVQTGSLLQKI